uniref:ribonuclease H n=1 Tax=Leptobrachium leishanense TaxID=445787 RepID=A0A8C5Q8I3_9ANUR
MDLLKRLNPITDFINEVIWSQVNVPISYDRSQSHHTQRNCHVIEERPDSIEVHFRNSQTPDISFLRPKSRTPGEQEDNTICVPPERIRDICLENDVLIIHLHKRETEPNGHSDHSQFLTEIEKINEEVFFPIRVNSLAGENMAKLDLRQEYSYISKKMLNKIADLKVIRYPNPQDEWITDLDNDGDSHNVVGKCMLSISIGNKTATHLFLVLNEPGYQIYVGNDRIHRFAMQVDLINSHIWTRLKENPCEFQDENKALKSCQTLPYAVNLQVPYEVCIPPGSVNYPLPLQVMEGQKLRNSEALVCISNRIHGLGISANPTPMVKIHQSRTQIIINNNSSQEIHLPKDTTIGLALDSDYYTFGFQNAVIGLIPERYLTEEQMIEQSFNSWPEGLFTIYSVYPFSSEVGICKVEESSVTFDHPLTTQEAEEYTHFAGDASKSNHDLSERLEEAYEIGQPEIFPGFQDMVQQQISFTDGCSNDMERQQLKEVLMEFQDIFAKDSYDCGVTDLHIARVQTDPNAPPVYVRQYWLPLACYDSLAEILRNLKERGIIRMVHSSYNNPILGILKPNGQWRLCADLRQLNKRVYRSGWPVPYIDQCLVQMQGCKLFTALDCAKGYWTIQVSPEDQYKLAFTFGQQQFTWTRMPFGYINSGHEFAVFLHKAMPDAAERGNLTYVDDILLKSISFEKHSQEIRHVLNQLREAGVKISLQKAQWCRTRVNFLGHEVTSEGLNPQRKKVEAVMKSRTPTNISELRSFLGMMNYSRKFIENYAEICKPLLTLLKKDVKWIWGETQEQAMTELKIKLTQAPCLAYPEGGKPFYLETGFTNLSMSAVLCQKQDYQSKIIAYASKSLSPVEIKFSDCEKALLATVWALQNFRSYIQGERIIIETAHQHLQYLHSSRIRDGNLSNSRITAWTLSLQGWPLEVRYRPDQKNPVAQGLAELHDCADPSSEKEFLGDDFLQEQASSPYKAYDEEYCSLLPRVYIDGCAYHAIVEEERKLVAGIGIAWTKEYPNISVGYNIGAKSSQVAELAAVYKAVQMAIDYDVKEFLIVTDSNYVRNSFVECLPGWKRNEMLRSNNKPVKHADLFGEIREDGD